MHRNSKRVHALLLENGKLLNLSREKGEGGGQCLTTGMLFHFIPMFKKFFSFKLIKLRLQF